MTNNQQFKISNQTSTINLKSFRLINLMKPADTDNFIEKDLATISKIPIKKSYIELILCFNNNRKNTKYKLLSFLIPNFYKNLSKVLNI